MRVCVNASAHRRVLVCERGDIILMLPDGVLHQFHIKAEQSGETARYKLLKQCNKTVEGCVCMCVCVCYSSL